MRLLDEVFENRLHLVGAEDRHRVWHGGADDFAHARALASAGLEELGRLLKIAERPDLDRPLLPT